MRWLLAGCFGLALINVSVAPNSVKVTQKPRFCGRFISGSVKIFCLYPTNTTNSDVTWYKAEEYNSEQKEELKMEKDKRIETRFSGKNGSLLFIKDLQIKDKGVYFCKKDNVWGGGTQLHVTRPMNYSKALYRTQMKDGLIIFQGLMCAMCIAAILLHKRTLQLEKRDSIYEEPETDHIYEGLTIETCGGGLYEELSVYAKAEDTEAPWE